MKFIRASVLVWSMLPACAMATGIESVTLMADNEGKPGETVELFVPSDLQQHFSIKLDELKTGNHQFVVEFWSADTTAGKNIKITDDVSSGLLANTITARVSLPREWPVGVYRMDVKMDGKSIGTYEYEVAEPEGE